MPTRGHVLELGDARHVVVVGAASARHKDIGEPELRTKLRARQALVPLQYPPQLEAIPSISVPCVPRYCDPSRPPLCYNRKAGAAHEMRARQALVSL